MPRGANAEREREYRELKHEFKQEGRYKGRTEEVAARIVNKQRSRFGETKAEKRKDRKGKSPDRNLPIPRYQHKTISQVERAMKSLRRNELKKVERYEKEHKNRKTLLEFIHDRLTDHQTGNSSASHSRSRHGSSWGSTQSHSRAHSSRTKSHGRSTRRSSNRGHSSHDASVTTDHDEIRRWVEERGGHPATVKATENRRGDPGILRIDFPDYSGARSLEGIDWDDFFEKFDAAKLAFLHQDRTAGGQKSRFNKLVSRND
jgi:hypothetical protein